MIKVSEVNNICKFKCSSCKYLEKMGNKKDGFWWYCKK